MFKNFNFKILKLNALVLFPNKFILEFIDNVEKNKTIDIIMPNYNKGKFITEAVDSVINQSYKN